MIDNYWRLEDPLPKEYRLARIGHLTVLQGYFTWIEQAPGGGTQTGGEWRTIPTVQL